MKLNLFFLFIALLFTALVSYACMVYCQNNFKTLFASFGSFGSLVYFLFLIAIQFDNIPTSINIKAFTTLFLAINAGLLIFFARVDSSASAFIIVYALQLLFYSSLLYSITKVKTKVSQSS